MATRMAYAPLPKSIKSVLLPIPEGQRRRLAAGLLPARVGEGGTLRTGVRALLAPRLRILVHPMPPYRWSVITRIAARNGYWLETDSAARYDLAVHGAQNLDGPSSLPADKGPVLNRDCRSVSKTHVARVFAEVFGYVLEVGPTTYVGAMVEKSDTNYTHDGRIVPGPIPQEEVRPGYVYQRLIDATEDGEAIDLRTPIYGGRVPLVYEKGRPLETRFSNTNTSVSIHDPNEVYSGEELERLAAFASAMGLDYAEIDVLRDADGRLYVVDVTVNPAGPPNGLPEREKARAVAILAEAFDEMCRSVLGDATPPSP